jgi:LysM repeat protein
LTLIFAGTFSAYQRRRAPKGVQKSNTSEFMSSNPFNLPTTYLADQQQMRRERVKVTFYAVVGTMVVFCLTLLFQGCKHQQIGTEIPAEVSSMTPPVETASSTLQSMEEPHSQTVTAAHAATPQAPAVQSPPVQAAVVQPSPAPVPRPVAAAPSIDYVIKQGDSLFGIAKAHGTTVQAIKSANQLSSDRILVGKSLKIPVVRS